MEHLAAIKLVDETLSKAFDRERFADFIRNILKKYEEKQLPGGRVRTGNYIYEPYRDLVESLDRLGKYSDSSGRTLEVLIVKLKPDQPIDRARTKQRNYVAYYLEHGRDDGSSRDAALVAFVEAGGKAWRFSLVRMEYDLQQTNTGKVKSEKLLSPARRYSFLVGAGENTHTARARFRPLLKDDSKQPSLEDLSAAFSVEAITDEFFEQYREIYLRVRDELESLVKKDKVVKGEFADKGITLEDFAKKLLGQIVFLYFLQRKGWLGVAEGEQWGTGPRDFLRQLFDKKYCTYKNFFNDVLEYLFYDMLAVDKGEKAWHEKFNCRIPFLNGGLFEPLFDYDWRKTNILIPNELFSNRRSPTDFEAGTGILDVFDRFNFTVREDEPLEKEVAVDPELLGKVFENLLEIRSRKSKGTYYTPREVVHFMCQESLILYLSKHLDPLISTEDIKRFILHGDSYVIHDARVIREGRETPTYRYSGPESVRQLAGRIDELLAEVKVCDPAVGSGAFPLGLLNEIVRARYNLNPLLADGELEPEGRDFYSLKWHAAENSIYGVDIDPGAIEIAKLRLWLSLVVDEESLQKIKPLPNLDFKLMQGNSLIDEFEGVQLIDPTCLKKGLLVERRKELLNKEISELQREYFQLLSIGGGSDSGRKSLLEEAVRKRSSELKALMKPASSKHAQTRIDGSTDRLQSNIDRLKGLHQQFFRASLQSDKKHLKEKILRLEWEVMEGAVRDGQRPGAMERLSSLKRANVRPFFLWHLHFSEIFTNDEGFDIVIANPPYGADIAGDLPVLERKFGAVIKNYADIYKMFFQMGIELLHNEGVLTLITPNTFVSQPRYKDLRTWLLNYNIEKVINLVNSPLF